MGESQQEVSSCKRHPMLSVASVVSANLNDECGEQQRCSVSAMWGSLSQALMARRMGLAEGVKYHNQAGAWNEVWETSKVDTLLQAALASSAAAQAVQ